MGDHEQRHLEDWLDAERAEHLDDADARFGALFLVHVPRLQPATSRANAIMAAIAAARHPVPVVVAMPVWERVAIVILLACAGLSAAAFWSTGIVDLARTVWVVVPKATHALLWALAISWSFAAHAGGVLVSVGRGLAVAAASGPAALAIAAQLTVALAASCALKRLLAPQEE